MGAKRDKKPVKKSAHVSSPEHDRDHIHHHHHHDDHDHAHDHAHDHHSHHHDHHGEPSHEMVEHRAPLESGCGRESVLFIDAFSGVAGDMLVAALVDLGVPQSVIARAIDPLPLDNYKISFEKVTRSGIAATRFKVDVKEQRASRAYADIRAMITDADALSSGARQTALQAFELLARAEAEVHGGHPDQVSFHEVGAVDSIVDIVAVSAALDYLGARVISSPLPMGRGFITCRHGVIPAPAPATVLCLRSVPTYDAGIDAELVTPTGACLVAVSATQYCRWPSLMSERVGWGAGTRQLPDRPNLLRVLLGKESKPERFIQTCPADAHLLLETNLDDQSGELIGYAVQSLFEAGALDAWTTSIGMKKGRPATMVSALTTHQNLDRVAAALFTETSTLGLRVREVSRIERHRRSVTVATAYGDISVKIADGDGYPANVAPEYESCRAAAVARGVPVKEVYAAALAAFRKDL